MNEYERRQEARRERYTGRAEKARRESQARYDTATEIANRRPFGQPILVGHHSERAARADQRRIDTNMQESIEAQRKAEHYDRKADAVGKGGISSDDPAALRKLRARLEELQARQDRMKLLNRVHQVYAKDAGRGERLMEEHAFTESERRCVRTYVPAYSWEPHPFPPYALSNNLANIKRIEQRLKELEAKSVQQSREEQISASDAAVTLIENVEDNRVQLVFPGTPPAGIRKLLKQNGFRWSRLAGAWQRHLTPEAVRVARSLLSKLGPAPEAR